VSRFKEYDEFEGEPEQILAQGRWDRNARAVLRSKRGRKALAEIREALMALPEHRLIEGAACTIGDVETRYPAITDAEMEQAEAKAREDQIEFNIRTPDYPARVARRLREWREDDREAYARLVEEKGAGVCLVAAYAWYKKVRAGMDPVEAFTAIPVLGDDDDGDHSRETADLGEDAGMAFTLAWELGYRNDETYGSKTPEGRWEAFVAWIDAELAGSAS